MLPPILTFFDASKIERPTAFSFGQVLHTLCLFISLCTPVQDNQVQANNNCDISANLTTIANYGRADASPQSKQTTLNLY